MDLFNKLIIHPSFKETLDEIRKVNITITERSLPDKFDFSSTTFPPYGKIRLIEEIATIDLDAKDGQVVAKDFIFAGYDESKLQYLSLEGSAYFTAHSMVIASKREYLPVEYLSFYFYTRSKNITEKSTFIQYSEDHKADANRDYVVDRSIFINKWSLENSILFIDGPLIGGNLTSYTLTLVENLHEKEIIPIFFVKNSDSNLVTDNIIELKQRYNSDMHWSYNQLKIGQRTNFFMYLDEYNPKNAKIFCYLKAFNLSPQRIEFHLDTYSMHKNKIHNLMNLIYYLLLVHGDIKNPQIRPIAIAEKYAREILKLTDSYNLIKTSGLIPTMNQERFG